MITQPFSNNQLWQRNLVLVAKNIYVWLTQLSRKYSRQINHLDQIPMEELEDLRSLGITGLWLVGIWERSPASQRIKRLYGRENLIASAYSINRYEVSDWLGGESAMEHLKENAQKVGIYLACDMVPNHTGLDSPWLLNHPDWYIGSKKKPVDTWIFTSDDLSPRPDVHIRLEDGYYTQQEAAEVFQYTLADKDEHIYIYHGNDGTSMPWNDTAQLDYLNPQVRQAVMDEITRVARRFPVIRLDAAMTLIRKHFKRLWYPDTGGDKFVPTRDAFPMSQDDFDTRMPNEFWSEVLDKLESSSPYTLMMAEAFWLMEKYFVHELGMHRVYNSAFLNQLRDEQNSKLRGYFQEILQSDPLLLDSFVNYLTTPDEKPAAEAFGRSEKYFGVCGLMAALPGLPLFGHGQIEGLVEQYGMDFSRPLLDENPDAVFIEAHRNWITPLLRQRERFSDARNLRLLDFLSDELSIDEDVFIFANRTEAGKSLIIYNNHDRLSKGRILNINSPTERQLSDRGSGPSLISILGLEGRAEGIFTELRTGESLALEIKELAKSGIDLSLAPYQLLVYDVR